MLESMVLAIGQIANAGAIGMLVIGVLIGSVFGALPGLGSVVALALVLPFTYGMDPLLAMLLYAGIISSAAFGGSVPAILLNTPGTPTNAATCLDGHAMARRGEGARAISISAASCLAGALGGVAAVLAILPFVKPIVLSFGPPEFFWLVMLGMVMVAFAARGNMIKGLIGGGIGVMLAMIGYDQMTGTFRFTFGSDYLWDGLSLVTFVTGLFAVSELIAYATQGGTTVSAAGSLKRNDWREQVSQGVRDVIARPFQVIRATSIGAFIGVIPGLGGAVASFMSYAIGSHQSRDPDYGRGSPEGIIASEAANDAKDGGALLPTVAFGIPGSPDMAILLGAFLLHGLQPGPSMLDTHLDLVLVLLFGIVLAQILTSIFGLAASSYLARLSLVRSRWIAPFVLGLVVAGTFMLNGNILDSGIAVAVGILGYVLRAAGFPLVTIAIGFILGPLVERSLTQSMLISSGSLRIFVDNPIALGLMLATFAMVLVPLAAALRRRWQEGRADSRRTQA